MGADLLAGSRHELHQYASVIARHHHERFDGSGYPDHLVGQNVLLDRQASRLEALPETTQRLLVGIHPTCQIAACIA
ncbi:hypothetical protein E0W60_31420 (plasmid) [Cupriavidus oxalaticus]|uniref:HD-GYP domain-containing protein n=1 Tax=Cupriavidus oxalaticus TaxID=96344 RepID=A0A4P7LM88_9BURK|nr:hypothetical protein E0W60_31420 [Cupriavidus oxalaticus]